MRSAVSLVILLLSSTLASPCGQASQSEGSASTLVSQMGQLQYFSHKLGLAVTAKNLALQQFYAHEVEEVVEKLVEIEDFDGIPIGKLVESILDPKVEILEHAIRANDAAAADSAYDEMLKACNTCHQNANRPYIQVERQTLNPYMQSFDPAR